MYAIRSYYEESHIDAIVDKLNSENALSGLLARGVLTISPPDYRNMIVASYTLFDHKLATVGVAGFVYVNQDAFSYNFV